MDALWIAITTLITAVIVTGGALLTTWLNGIQIRAGKEQDYKRADEVARLLLERQDAAAEKAAQAARDLIRSNQEVAEQARLASEVVGGSLKRIHKFMNSDKTKQMEDDRESLRLQLILMKEIVSLTEHSNRKPAQASLDAISATERKIANLDSQLLSRARDTEIADSMALGEAP